MRTTPQLSELLGGRRRFEEVAIFFPPHAANHDPLIKERQRETYALGTIISTKLQFQPKLHEGQLKCGNRSPANTASEVRRYEQR